MWHHTDYLNQKRRQHIWDRLLKRFTYVALANSFGEYSGRPHPLDIPYLEPSASGPPIWVGWRAVVWRCCRWRPGRGLAC